MAEPWAAAETRGADLQDRRLNARLGAVLSPLGVADGQHSGGLRRTRGDDRGVPSV